MSLTASNLLTRIKTKYGQDSEGKDYIRDDEFMRKLCEAVVSFTNVTTVANSAGVCTGTLQNGKIN